MTGAERGVGTRPGIEPAPRLADKHAGVIAYSMDIDEEGRDYGAPRVLFQAGKLPEL